MKDKQPIDSYIDDLLGVDYDFSALQNGQQVEGESPATGLITKEGDVINIIIQYHYNAKLAEPNQPKDIAFYSFDVNEGNVPHPIYWKTLKQAYAEYDEGTETYTLTGYSFTFDDAAYKGMSYTDDDVLRTWKMTGSSGDVLSNLMTLTGLTSRGGISYLTSLIPEKEEEENV